MLPMIIKLRGLSLYCRCCILHCLLCAMAACKVPCRITRVLGERCCPLHAVAHTTSDYPLRTYVHGFCDFSLSTVAVAVRALSCSQVVCGLMAGRLW
ncbi:uncharacterized protein F5891DRAFT_993776 [Suillus fuscotomentosus]|uniref:Secreted protein n=1 Tax=Suillus fuscotomentosus TaxID=1912939 RepID=A0AAD4EPX3_9AGAM|nr:uncharacterized protein F5891DRAFT_993776 [Suillus fuscotomentosus]KAG1908554.1 hypothetical protein F5891DRAFT_993776 [Suillus fuscotomentosus]